MPSMSELLDSVPREWHSSFRTLLSTGELDPGFSEFLEGDEGTQRAIDMAFRMRVDAAEQIISAIGRAEQGLADALSPEATAATLAAVSRMNPREVVPFAEEVTHNMGDALSDSRQRRTLIDFLTQCIEDIRKEGFTGEFATPTAI